ncbi:hypothetical protein [Streptomyces sp. BH104]|uniref:hypothetical protein n=1 Tax=Streptomyces sp. BH104 TaxID=3410407 RepID=UPI003BB558B1
MTTQTTTAVSLEHVLDGAPREQFVVWLDEYSSYLYLGHITADEAQSRIRTGYTADPATLEHQQGWFDKHESDDCVPDGDDCQGHCHEQPWWFRTGKAVGAESVDVTFICAGYVGSKSKDVIARCPTRGGATVELAYAPHSGAIFATCTGVSCGWEERTDTGSLAHDPPEKEDFLVGKHLPAARPNASTHAATCSAPPSSTGRLTA